MTIIENKCPNCSGELLYDPTSKELKCVQCSSIIDIPEQDALLPKKPYSQHSTIETSSIQYTQYKCSTCGKRHIAPVSKDVLYCPSCGAATLDKAMGVEYVPDGIIPFMINKEQALLCFKDWLKRRKFAPNNLKKKAKSQTLQGIYSPLYNFDADTFTQYSGVGITEHTDSEGRTRTSRHPFSGSRAIRYDDFAESANSMVPSDVLRDVANYDFNKIYVYRTEFLYGWIASEVEVNLHEACTRARNNMASDIRDRIKRSLHYDRIENFVCNTTFSNLMYKYLYVPVWINTYKYKEKVYNCYINGVTGKVSGKAPKSFWKIFFTVIGVIAAVAGIFFFAYYSNSF